MNCPICKKQLLSTILHNVEVDYCPKCLGFWFEQDELRWVKDAKDEDLKWLDIDLWEKPEKFKISRVIRLCPSCRMPLYEVYYGDSGNLPAGRQVAIDVCNVCQGIWLDRGEFKKIMDWLKKKADYEIINNYSQNLFLELAEVFSGPETLREEILDFLAILKIINYKFAAKYSLISKIISVMPQ